MSPGQILFHGVGANAGKTVFTRATCRWRSNEGRKVAPFKPVSVGKRFVVEADVSLDFRMWLLGAAARCEVGWDNAPVQVRAHTGSQTGDLSFAGEAAGTISLMADDSPLLVPEDERYQRARESVAAAMARLGDRHDEVIVEGAGCSADLGAGDLANLFVARLTGAPIVLVASAGAGGALTGVAGLVASYPEDLRGQFAGFALNDVRTGAGQLLTRAGSLGDDLGVRFLGGFPHAEIYDMIPPGEHSSLCDDEAEYEWLAERLVRHIDLSSAFHVQDAS